MGHIGEKLNIDFVISTGDNFYDDGLTSDRDSNFEESFTKIYTAKSLQKPWYAGKSPDMTMILTHVRYQTDIYGLNYQCYIICRFKKENCN